MRPPNFYAHPGFERAGLRRRDTGWILERITDPASLFVPVWRNQNLVIELDDAEPRELFAAISPTDPLSFRDTKRYRDRLKSYQQAVGERDAVIVVQGTIEEMPVVLAAMEYRFMGGSMGSVVGEKITRAAERAVDRKVPLIVVSASGGPACRRGSCR